MGRQPIKERCFDNRQYGAPIQNLIWKTSTGKEVREGNAAALQKQFSFYNSIDTLTYSSSNIVKFLKALPFNPFMSLSFRRLRYLPYKTDD